MISSEDLYMMDVDALHADLYRMGNAASPNFSESRSLKDCSVIDRDGFKIVLANGYGFSAFSFITPDMRRGGKIWRIKKGTPLPHDLRLVKDLTRQGHYMLAPAVSMPLSKFLDCSKR